MDAAENPYAPPAADLAGPALAAPPFFAVSPAKLLLLSAATFGIYPAWWSYKNWRSIREQSGENISPIPRAIFSGFTNFSLFPRLQTTAAKSGLHTRAPHELFALAYFALSIAIQVTPDENPLGLLLAPLVGVPYLASNALTRRMNLAAAPDGRPTAAWTPLNAFGVLLGFGLFALATIGTIFGDVE